MRFTAVAVYTRSPYCCLVYTRVCRYAVAAHTVCTHGCALYFCRLPAAFGLHYPAVWITFTHRSRFTHTAARLLHVHGWIVGLPVHLRIPACTRHYAFSTYLTPFGHGSLPFTCLLRFGVTTRLPFTDAPLRLHAVLRSFYHARILTFRGSGSAVTFTWFTHVQFYIVLRSLFWFTHTPLRSAHHHIPPAFTHACGSFTRMVAAYAAARFAGSRARTLPVRLYLRLLFLVTYHLRLPLYHLVNTFGLVGLFTVTFAFTVLQFYLPRLLPVTVRYVGSAARHRGYTTGSGLHTAAFTRPFVPGSVHYVLPFLRGCYGYFRVWLRFWLVTGWLVATRLHYG